MVSMIENLQKITFLFLLIAGFVSAIKLLKTSKPFGNVLPSRLRLQSPVGLADVAFVFFVWFILMEAARFYISQSFGEELGEASTAEQSASMMFWMAVAQLVATTIGLGVISVRYGHVPRVLGVQTENLRNDFKIGFWAFVVVIPFVLLIQIALAYLVDYAHPTIELMKQNQTPALISAAV